MKKSIGTISLGEISFLSDSCYGTYSDLNTTIKTKPGEYKVYVTYCEDKNDFLKGRIGSLIAIHKDAKDKTFPTDDRENLKCYVDSGTCGIFDGEYFEETHTADDVDETYYSLQYFLDLAAKGDTNAIDILFAYTNKDAVIYIDPIFQEIIDNIDWLIPVFPLTIALCIVHAFSGAIEQLETLLMIVIGSLLGKVGLHTAGLQVAKSGMLGKIEGGDKK